MAQLPNYSRMFNLIDEVFAIRNDPNQLYVDEKATKKLQAIHPATLGEIADKNGPVVWVLMIPTTTHIMEDFLSGKISEKQILENTEPGKSYNCIYLCSATTLPEYRGHGQTKKLCVDSIWKICMDHPIMNLFVWPFTADGEILAESISNECLMKLFKKKPVKKVIK